MLIDSIRENTCFAKPTACQLGKKPALNLTDYCIHAFSKEYLSMDMYSLLLAS